MVLPTELVGEAQTSTAAWELLGDLVDVGNRMAGQAGEAEGAAILRRRFEEHGLVDPTTTEFEVPGWWRGSSALAVSSPRERRFDGDYELVALPGTPACDRSARIVDVGHGTAEEFAAADVEGAFALVSSGNPPAYDRWVHRGEKYALAVDAGAAGFLFYNTVPGSLPITGSIGGEDGPGAIPAVGLSKELGRRLVRYTEGDDLTGTLTVDCRTGPATSRNVEATLGPDTDEEVLLTAHVDAHDLGEGATDNGVGCALVSEVARLLKRIEGDLETGVRVVVFGSEEIGLLGAHHWARTHDLDRVKCAVNVDGNGTWQDVAVYAHGSDKLAGAFEATVDEMGAAFDVTDAYLPHSDHWPLVQRGVPGAMVRSESRTGRGWGHTHADTLDKLDVRDLRRLAASLTDAVLRLTQSEREISHLEEDEVAAALREDGQAEGMRAAGDWPW
jgi:Zn-dependent M28 family amino/carboxypeptidase